MKYLIKKPDTFFSTINDEIEHVLHKSFDNMFPEYLFNVETQGMTMPVDIQEFDNEYKIKAELPGIKKEDIDLDVTKSSLKIHAQKSEEKEENNKKYHKSEFRYGIYNRTIHFPMSIFLKGGQNWFTLWQLNLKTEKTAQLWYKMFWLGMAVL